MDTTSNEQWDCEAYGPGSDSFGALCFFAEQGKRACISESMCHLAMAGERVRAFTRLRELAAGDQVWAEIAKDFTSPGQLLNGGTGQPPPG
jgi:hypothetical protein